MLTSLLVSHGVRHIVVCPGSRNAVLSHNFNECPDIVCHSVTDERSAGFVALGIRETLGENTAVCVTSGSALLNLLPAVAEATYRHQGIIVISADRPSAWIGQNDGQVIPQVGALGNFVSLCVNLPEPHDDIERWECNRLVNEALLEAGKPSHPSVQINIPISEPLFDFSVATLPSERVIRRTDSCRAIEMLMSFKRPMLVIGQECNSDRETDKLLDSLSERLAILAEPLSYGGDKLLFTDQMIYVLDNEDARDLLPDCIAYIGGNTVSKRLRQLMRKCKGTSFINVSDDGRLHDISSYTTFFVERCTNSFIKELASCAADDTGKNPFASAWNELRSRVAKAHASYTPGYSQMLAVQLFENGMSKDDIVHYANSMSVRLAEIHARHYCHCNRGLNGIEGSLSTAAGAALACKDNDRKVYCVIGDLSFFYDENALWQKDLGGNFRILMMNNSRGAIFNSLTGLDKSPAEGIVAGDHCTSADGICSQFSLNYKKVCGTDSLQQGIDWLQKSEFTRPALLEVVTDAKTDNNEVIEYYRHLL